MLMSDLPTFSAFLPPTHPPPTLNPPQNKPKSFPSCLAPPLHGVIWKNKAGLPFLSLTLPWFFLLLFLLSQVPSEKLQSFRSNMLKTKIQRGKEQMRTREIHLSLESGKESTQKRRLQLERSEEYREQDFMRRRTWGRDRCKKESSTACHADKPLRRELS